MKSYENWWHFMKGDESGRKWMKVDKRGWNWIKKKDKMYMKVNEAGTGDYQICGTGFEV